MTFLGFFFVGSSGITVRAVGISDRRFERSCACRLPDDHGAKGVVGLTIDHGRGCVAIRRRGAAADRAGGRLAAGEQGGPGEDEDAAGRSQGNKP